MFEYLGPTVTNQNLIYEEVKTILNLGYACCHSFKNLLFSRLPLVNVNCNFTCCFV
jgi:hypothetical protein